MRTRTPCSTAATGKPLAHAWLHCERVLKEGRPLKDEAAAAVRDLTAQGFSGADLRFFLLATHYRKPLAFTPENLKAAAQARARLDHFLARLSQVAEDRPADGAIEERLFQLKKEFVAALDDDLNISRVLSGLFALVGDLNADLDRGRLGQGAGRRLQPSPGAGRSAGSDEPATSRRDPGRGDRGEGPGPGRGPPAPGLDRRR